MDGNRHFPSAGKVLASFRDNPLKDHARHPHHQVIGATLFTYGVPIMRYDTSAGRYVFAPDAPVPQARGQTFKRDAGRAFPFAVRLPHVHATWLETQEFYNDPRNAERYNFDNYRKDAEHYFTARPHHEEVVALQQQLQAQQQRELEARKPPPNLPTKELVLFEYFGLPSPEHYYAHGRLRSPYGTDALSYNGVVLAKPDARGRMLIAPPVTLYGRKAQAILDMIYDHLPDRYKIVPCIPPPEDPRDFMDGIAGAMRIIAQTLENTSYKSKRTARLAHYYSLLTHCTRTPAYTPTPAQHTALKRFGAYLARARKHLT
jgi:hypothetical protein